MLTFPSIDPVALQLGPLAIHWYGIAYMVAIFSAWKLALIRGPRGGFTPQQISDLIFYGALGLIAGGRIGYVLFYNFSSLLDDPLLIFRVWQGGMSFHGGLLGMIVAVLYTAWRQNKKFYQVMDFVAPIIPLGLGAGRLGNFLGGELWGRPTDVPWGMVFPHVDNLARHPSQLYQMFLEGVVLFTIVWLYSSKPRPALRVSGMFLFVYGLQRFLVEFFRQPDAHLNFVAFGWMSQGQLLTLPMLMIGIYLVLRPVNK